MSISNILLYLHPNFTYMKKLFTLTVCTLLTSMFMQLKAQNIQLLFDPGRDCVTSTVEMFRPDAGGSTFFFIDFDYCPVASTAYWEISREFNFWQDTNLSWLSAHLEYDGGLCNSGSYNNSWLAGATYSGHSKDFSKTWSLSAMYKIDTFAGVAAHGFQITGVWGINFLKGWCSFSGFADLWKTGAGSFVFLSEPQFWVNLNKIKGWENINLSVGGEVELSANFFDGGFQCMPAIGAKWTF